MRSKSKEETRDVAVMSYDPGLKMSPSPSATGTSPPQGQQWQQHDGAFNSLLSTCPPLRLGRRQRVALPPTATEDNGSPIASSPLQQWARETESFDSSLSPLTSSVFASSFLSSKPVISDKRNKGVISEYSLLVGGEQTIENGYSNLSTTRVEQKSQTAAKWKNGDDWETPIGDRTGTKHHDGGSRTSEHNIESNTEQVFPTDARLPEDFSSLSSNDEYAPTGQQEHVVDQGDASDRHHALLVTNSRLQRSWLRKEIKIATTSPGLNATDGRMSPQLTPAAGASEDTALLVAVPQVACSKEEDYLTIVVGISMYPPARPKIGQVDFEKMRGFSDDEEVVSSESSSCCGSSKAPGSDHSGERKEMAVIPSSHKKPSSAHLDVRRVASGDRDEIMPVQTQQKRKHTIHSNSQWQTCYQHLLAYKSQHGDCNVPFSCKNEPDLAKWVKRQRYQYKCKVSGKKSHLTDERQQLLEDIGFVWDTHVAAWEENYSKLSEFWRRNGHTHVPMRERKLNAWAKRQRRNYKQHCDSKSKDMSSTMTEDRIRLLNEIGFPWNLPTKMLSNALQQSSFATGKSNDELD